MGVCPGALWQSPLNRGRKGVGSEAGLALGTLGTKGREGHGEALGLTPSGEGAAGVF